MSRGRVEAFFDRARAGQLAAVLAELRAHLAAHEGDAEAWLALGLVLADAERWTEALGPLQRVTSSREAPLVARVVLARAFEHTGDFEGARAQLEAAHLASPAHVSLTRALASVLRRAGDLDGAAARLREAQTYAFTDADRAIVACDFGGVFRARGDLGASLASYRDATSLDPSLSEAWLAIAEVHAEIFDLASALNAVGAVLARDVAHSAATRIRIALERKRAELHATRLVGRPLSAIDARPLVSTFALRSASPRMSSSGMTVEARFDGARARLLASADATGAIVTLFFASHAVDAAAIAADAVVFLTDALGAPLSAAAAAHLLASLATGNALVLDDLRISAVDHEGTHDGAHGLRVTRIGARSASFPPPAAT